MIVVDSSAVITIVKAEPDARTFASTMRNAPALAMAAPTKLEVMMVAGGQYGPEGLLKAQLLFTELAIQILAWSEPLSDRAVDAFMEFGKGRHPAQLNFGDCMAYALAKSLDAPLLYKGGDFSKTDIRSAL
ncbi:MAG: type II toxin-antitoxin system VapC family toxin [Sphingopyxis sp.]|nr:type II toxin-antitoxin system VapC family toxin [Sphingopyxis sp.]